MEVLDAIRRLENKFFIPLVVVFSCLVVGTIMGVALFIKLFNTPAPPTALAFDIPAIVQHVSNLSYEPVPVVSFLELAPGGHNTPIIVEFNDTGGKNETEVLHKLYNSVGANVLLSKDTKGKINGVRLVDGSYYCISCVY